MQLGLRLILCTALASSSLSVSLASQTGRVVTLAQPVQLGKTAQFDVVYPAAAVGNPGWFVLAGHLAETTTLAVPGFSTAGAVRFSPLQILATVPWAAAGSGGGTASMKLRIPRSPGLLGIAFDVQSLDVDLAARTLYWSDNDLELVIVEAGCGDSTAVRALHPPGGWKEPEVVVDTPTARITYLSDRARDRHARESQFQQYDHWLPFYWEQRIAELTITDEVARGGTRVVFRFMAHDRLNPAEFRAYYAAGGAVYHLNLSSNAGQGVTQVSSVPSQRYPGETEYTYEAVLTTKIPEQRPLRIGDRIEVELSQFLGAPRNGRANYYGTAFLYVVGEGVVPWYAKQKEEATTPQQQQSASFDSYRLPDVAWLGGNTTLPYQYSNEPRERFKQTAGNISHASGHEFVLGRRLHHTDFGTGAHSEPGNPPLSSHAGQLGPKFIAASCVACHVDNGRSLPPAVGSALTRSVVRVGADPTGAPHPVLGDTLQPSLAGGQGGTVNVSIEAESYVAMSGVQIEPTLDGGGGFNVTSIDTDAWMSYANQPVMIPASGLYRVGFRVASAVGGGLLAFEESGGSIIHGRVSMPNTGGWQTWQTVTADLWLSQGSHVFGLNANVGGFNLNWFQVASLPSGGGGGTGGGGPANEGQVILDGYDLLNGTYGDGRPYQLRRPRYRLPASAPTSYSVRNAPPLVGLGLLEAIDEATILARHDPCDEDADGISGRVSVTTEFATGHAVLGRFGWKGSRASVRDQIARALNRDMGVASASQPYLDGETTPSAPEVTALELDRLARYTALLGVAARRDLTDPAALRGERLFAAIGCADCHVPQLTTGSDHPYGELRNQTIRPFTDLLLHDMGDGLAARMADGDATASEWRTAPLWSIGLTAAVAGGEAYLHDGRARTLEEALLWHGGEGAAAMEAFRTLPAADRSALVAFLTSL